MRLFAARSIVAVLTDNTVNSTSTACYFYIMIFKKVSLRSGTLMQQRLKFLQEQYLELFIENILCGINIYKTLSYKL